MKNSGTLLISLILIVFGLFSAKKYLKHGTIVFRHWAYSTGGLVMDGWQALSVVCFMLCFGIYGLIWWLKNR